MNKLTEFTQDDYALIEREWADLKEAVRQRGVSGEQFLQIQKAYDFAASAHKGVRRRSGDPYIIHPIAVAKIVCNEIGLGYKSICAALLHDVVEDTSYNVDDIHNLFDEKTAALVGSLAQIKAILEENRSCSDSESQQAENFRRILLTLGDDARVVLIKLADRLHNCRTIEYLPEYKREQILSETMSFFIPLSHRLGLYSVKSEMENIWLRFKQPQAYNSILARINSDTSNKDRMINEFLAPIRHSLDEAGIVYSIKKRVKTPYSIWYKITNKHVTFEQIADLYAVRIVFTPKTENIESERDECFHIFSLVTGFYDYVPERVRDWVSHPKSNGYEALHLTALTSDHRTGIEVQIRSKRMDDIAEKGIAAHWNYKKLNPQASESQMDIWISKIKEILQNPDVNAMELLGMVHHDFAAGEIFVFDSKGVQHSVESGSTALDFAFLQNNDPSKQPIAAKINYRLSALSTPLRSGDKVEIISVKSKGTK